MPAISYQSLNHHFLQQDGIRRNNRTSIKSVKIDRYGRNNAVVNANWYGHSPEHCDDIQKSIKGVRTVSRRIRTLSVLPKDSLINDYQSEDGGIISIFKRDLTKQLNCLYQFSRPHTIIGTVLGITSVSLLPIETIVDFSPTFFVGLVKALVPSLLMNIYVVGLNQLFDVEIDKVNKPYLPLASGDYSMGVGITIVFGSLLISVAMGIMFQSPPLLWALLTSFVLGTAYSIEHPFFRWKKQPLLAASCIVIVRALIVQVAFYLHMQIFVLGKGIAISRSLVFATAFMCFFSTVIALFKDIPDVEGDAYYGIESFTVKLGQKKVFWLCVNMLFVAYGSGLLIGGTSSNPTSKLVVVLGHSVLAFIMWIRARSVDLTSKVDITSFYMFIWKLFYAEYFLIPFVR